MALCNVLIRPPKSAQHIPQGMAETSLLVNDNGHVFSAVKDKHLATSDQWCQSSELRVSSFLKIREHRSHGYRSPNRGSLGPLGPLLALCTEFASLCSAVDEGFLFACVNSRKQKTVSAGYQLPWPCFLALSASQLGTPAFSQSAGRMLTAHCPSVHMQEQLPPSPQAWASFQSPYLSVKGGPPRSPCRGSMESG